MIITKTKTIKTIVPIMKICDRCKFECTEGDWEWATFFHYETVAGYASIWGDSNKLSCDICENCFYEIFKDIMTIKQGGV